jgi:hypothetical protein
MGDQWRDSGERRKSRDQDLGDVLGSFAEPLASSCMRRFCARGRALMTESGGKTSFAIGSKETDGS